jgi:hypothetical protein
MTRYNKTLLSLLIPLLISISGCLDEKVKTTINSDGSCQRMISMKLQSKSLPDKAFPVSGPGWTVEWRESGDTSAPYEYVATKTFNTPEELHNEYLTDSLTKAMRINVVIQKRFRWFFTYLDYRETYFYQNPFGHVPILKYLTPEEIERFQRDEKTDTMKKFEQLIQRDQFEEFYSILIDEIQRINDPTLTVSSLHDNKERFASILANDDSTRKAGKKFSDTTLTQEDVFLNIYLEVGKQVFGNAAAEKLRPAMIQAFHAVDIKEKLTKFPDSWEYSTVMPGLLLESNSSSIQGNCVTWKFSPDQAKVAPFVMHASSRVANVWAFIVSGALLLILVVILVIAGIRRRRSHSSSII